MKNTQHSFKIILKKCKKNQKIKGGICSSLTIRGLGTGDCDQVDHLSTVISHNYSTIFPLLPVHSSLDRWQADAVELAVEVKGVDIGHSADVVEYALQFLK